MAFAVVARPEAEAEEKVNELRLEIPAIPPSAGHYNAYRVAGRPGGKQFVQCYPTADAKAWWDMVAAINAGRVIRGSALELQYIVYMPDRRRRDVDNAAKQICDSLTRCGAIEDDWLITDIHGHKRFDPLNPRTVIVIRTDQNAMFEGN